MFAGGSMRPGASYNLLRPEALEAMWCARSACCLPGAALGPAARLSWLRRHMVAP